MDADRPLKPTGELTLQRSLDQDEWLASKRTAEVNNPSRQQDRLNAVPQLDLSRWRFAATVAVSLGLLLAVLLTFVKGVVIDKDVIDELGSTTNANEKVELYQVIKGYITATFGLLVEKIFEVFIVVTITFLTNVRWYPGDQPNTGGNRVKRFFLWAFPPWIMFVLNVSISATFVSHHNTRIDRIFLHDDLVMNKAFSVATLNASTPGNLTALGNKRSVLDTVLLGAVRRQVVPFKMLTDSPCVVGNETAGATSETVLPSVKEVRSTAVVYGFPLQEWNLDAMPFGLVPDHTVQFKLSEVNGTQSELTRKFEAFRTASKMSWTTAYEMLLQGKLLFERSISDSDVSAEYPCIRAEDPGLYFSIVDAVNEAEAEKANATTNHSTPAPTTKKPAARRRFLQTTAESSAAGEEELGDEVDDEAFDELADELGLFTEGPFKGERKCYGAVSSLWRLANMTNPSMHKIDVFLNTMIASFIDTVEEIEPESMDLTISTYAISPQIKLTAMTLDMPYLENTPYRDTAKVCDGDVLKPEALEDFKAELGRDPTKEELEATTAIVCDQTSYPYLEPREACGHSNCVFLDKSKTISFKKQLQLMPYLSHCAPDKLQYNTKYLNFFPSDCKPEQNAVFLYGLGSYMGGDVFSDGDGESVPFIDNPRRHIVLSFARLEWKTEDLSAKFQAECRANATNCKGLLFNLENVTQPALNITGQKEKYVRMLVLGEDQLPGGRNGKDFRDPVQLLSLNTRPFYYAKDKAYYEWEYIEKSHFKVNTWPNITNGKGGLTSESCSPLVDSYITQVEKNHFYMDDPLQPLYTSALYYLFQDAAVKTVKVGKNVTTGAEVLELSIVGTTRLKGDLEKHVIKFSIPLASMVSTFIGMLFLLFIALLALVCPTERLKMSEETNIAVRYAELLQNDEYPSEVFERTLLLPSGDQVQMDEYVVESATVHFTRDEDKKVFL